MGFDITKETQSNLIFLDDFAVLGIHDTQSLLDHVRSCFEDGKQR
jgi:hypothetical protein